MKKIPKKYLPLLIAGIAGVIAVFLINVYIQQQTARAKEEALRRQKMLVTVIVAKKDIPAGVMIEEDMIKEETLRKDMIQPNAATSVARVLNKVTLAPIAKGEQILTNKVAITGQEISLSSKVPRDKRAITIPVDNISSVGGMLRPGDHVDILGAVPIPMMTAEEKQTTQISTIPLFQDVLVLAVGTEYAAAPTGEKGERRASPMVTLALAPEEANIVAFVQEHGKIRLLLRSPQDTKKQLPVPATWETVLRMVMPDLFKEQPRIIPKPKRQVEIIRGTTKEIKELE